MDNSTKKEIQGRSLRQEAYDRETSVLNKLQLRLIALFGQTHETVSIAGIRLRRSLSKRRKIAKASKLIDQALDGVPDIENDVRNQVKLLDNSDA